MFLTEDEARGYWCPLGRQVGCVDRYQTTYVVGSVNRVDHGDVPACLASQCMAWRWATPKPLRDIDLVTSDVVDPEPRRGYCGAFGVPQHGD